MNTPVRTQQPAQQPQQWRQIAVRVIPMRDDRIVPMVWDIDDKTT